MGRRAAGATADLPEDEMSGINLIWITSEREKMHASGKEDQ